MACVAATLSEFARNPRWLGAEPAFTLVLHTWTQDLRRHLHVHVLIACGGLDAQGNWVEPKRNPYFLFPVHALSRVFQAKFLDALETAHQAGRLPRDPAATPEAWAYRRRRLLRHDWVVYAKTPLGGPAEVLDYLSRYTHRTALSNERIVAIRDGEVLLRVRADHQGGKRVIRIPGAVFIGRFLQHVLPPGFKQIRHYGLLASARKRERLAQTRQVLRLPEPPRRRSKPRKISCGGWRKKKSRAVLAVNTAPYGSWRLFRRITPPWSVRIPCCCPVPPAGVHPDGYASSRTLEKMALVRQGSTRLWVRV
jgi:hypothetical protein